MLNNSMFNAHLNEKCKIEIVKVEPSVLVTGSHKS